MTTESTKNAPGTPVPAPLLPPTDPRATPRNGKRKRALLILASVIVLAAIGWLLYHFLVGRWSESTDDAYVQGDIVSITPQTGGTVTRIGVDDGMKVDAGQVLVNFDVEDAQLGYSQAEAALGAAVRQVRGLYSAVNAGEADSAARAASVNQALAAVAQAREDVARRSGLVSSGAVSAEELAHARTALAGAEANLAAARAAQTASQANVSRTRTQIDNSSIRDNPQVVAAAAQLRQAYLARQRSAIVAPVSGYVAKRNVQLGQRVAPGTPLMAIIPLQGVWVDANFKETQLKNLRLGQRAELTSEMYGDNVVYHGTLQSLGMGTGSAFSLLPAQNASGNWIKIVQRVPVRIALDPKELLEHPLRVGLTMGVKVNLHDKGNGLLPATTTSEPHAVTSAYDAQMSKADAEVDRIIRDNLGGTR